MALATFVAAFLLGTSPLGPVFFTGGLIVAYGLTFGDELLGLSLQPATSGNAPQLELPEIVFVSPEEALVQTLLWLGVAVTLPLGVLIAANLLTGRDPARVLRDALAERLAASAQFCDGQKGAELQLEAQAFETTAGLHKLHGLAGLLRRGRRVPVPSIPLIDEIGRLGLLLLASSRTGDNAREALIPAADFCRFAERAVRTGESLRDEPTPIAAAGAARLLGDAISHSLKTIAEALNAPPAAPSAKTRNASRSPRRLLTADAFKNPAHVRFAIKLTLAVMTCYFIRSIADWSSIGTCIATCFVVALGTVGETLHKATLRISGALVGAGLGLAALLLLMPLMTNLGDLLLLLAPVTLLAAWIGCGTDRISYAGVQIALAFYLIVLHGTGPTIDMYTARDRIIGILLGNVVMFVIFTTIWPVSVASVVRTNVAKALGQLAALGSLGGGADGSISQSARSAISSTCGQAIAQARAVLVNDRFETSQMRRAAARRPIDATVVAEIGRLIIPVSMMLDLIASPGWRDLPQSTRDAISAYQRGLSDWFQRAASWVGTGERAVEVAHHLPQPPNLSGTNDWSAAFATWSGVLDQDIRKILNDIGPSPEPAIISPAQGALRAAG